MKRPCGTRNNFLVWFVKINKISFTYCLVKYTRRKEVKLGRNSLKTLSEAR